MYVIKKQRNAQVLFFLAPFDGNSFSSELIFRHHSVRAGNLNLKKNDAFVPIFCKASCVGDLEHELRELKLHVGIILVQPNIRCVNHNDVHRVHMYLYVLTINESCFCRHHEQET